MQKRPSNQEINEEVVENPTTYFNNQDLQTFPSGRHVWRQQGPYCVCKECPLHHAVYIGMDKIMVGEDDEGKPILKSRQEVFGNK